MKKAGAEPAFSFQVHIAGLSRIRTFFPIYPLVAPEVVVCLAMGCLSGTLALRFVVLITGLVNIQI
jgi:hypothetical protein